MEAQDINWRKALFLNSVYLKPLRNRSQALSGDFSISRHRKNSVSKLSLYVPLFPAPPLQLPVKFLAPTKHCNAAWGSAFVGGE